MRFRSSVAGSRDSKPVVLAQRLLGLLLEEGDKVYGKESAIDQCSQILKYPYRCGP
jgi:hypothetical protein